MNPSLEQLVLVRHAHAEPAGPGQADADRGLSPLGRAEGRALGHWLLASIPAPDLVLCSPARRTRETLAELVEAGCRLPAVEFEPRIYEATPGTLLALADDAMAARPDVRRIWMIGHNPGLELLMAHLDDGVRAGPLGLRTGSAVVLAPMAGSPFGLPASARLAAFHPA